MNAMNIPSYSEYLLRCKEYSTPPLSRQEWDISPSYEDDQYLAYAKDMSQARKPFLGHHDWRKQGEYAPVRDTVVNELAPEKDEFDRDYDRYVARSVYLSLEPLSRDSWNASNQDEENRYFAYVCSPENTSVMQFSEWLVKDRAVMEAEYKVVGRMDLNVRYHEYKTMCELVNVQVLPFEEWFRFDLAYQKHVYTASDPMPPYKFQTEIWLKKSIISILSYSQQLEETLKVNKQLTVKLSDAESKIDHLNQQLAISNELEDRWRETSEGQLAANQELRTDLDRWRAANNALNEEVKATRKAADSNAQLFQECDKQRVAAEQNNLALQEEVLKLRKQYDEQLKHSSKLVDEIDDLHKGRGEHIQKLTREGQLFDKRLANREAVVAKYATMNEEKALRIMTLEKQLTERERYIADLHTRHETVCNELKLCEVVMPLKDTRPALAPVRTPPANQPEFPHYFREVPETTSHVDVYWVLKAWNVTDPCVQHSVKKLLCTGQRGVKSRLVDLTEARNSLNRAIELEQTK
jgi:hypothetical protein